MNEMEQHLMAMGDMFHGGLAEEVAKDWTDYDFTAATADPWTSIGVWDASTAAMFRDSGCSPQQIVDAAAEFPGDAIYAACNADLDPLDIIAVGGATSQEREAHRWAIDQQGYEGTLADWLGMSDSERAEYLAG